MLWAYSRPLYFYAKIGIKFNAYPTIKPTKLTVKSIIMFAFMSLFCLNNNTYAIPALAISPPSVAPKLIPPRPLRNH